MAMTPSARRARSASARGRRRAADEAECRARPRATRAARRRAHGSFSRLFARAATGAARRLRAALRDPLELQLDVVRRLEPVLGSLARHVLTTRFKAGGVIGAIS
jgi:hypothetical protein